MGEVEDEDEEMGSEGEAAGTPAQLPLPPEAGGAVGAGKEGEEGGGGKRWDDSSEDEDEAGRARKGKRAAAAVAAAAGAKGKKRASRWESDGEESEGSGEAASKKTKKEEQGGGALAGLVAGYSDEEEEGGKGRRKGVTWRAAIDDLAIFDERELVGLLHREEAHGLRSEEGISVLELLRRQVRAVPCGGVCGGWGGTDGGDSGGDACPSFFAVQNTHTDFPLRHRLRALCLPPLYYVRGL